ncbi:MAG: hypothetical protein ABI833_01240 [Acidobacteriota bacterium]
MILRIGERTFQSLNRIAPTTRQRVDFVRTAIRKAIREAEDLRTRNTYLAQPDSATDADEWSNAGAWKSLK